MCGGALLALKTRVLITCVVPRIWSSGSRHHGARPLVSLALGSVCVWSAYQPPKPAARDPVNLERGRKVVAMLQERAVLTRRGWGGLDIGQPASSRG